MERYGKITIMVFLSFIIGLIIYFCFGHYVGWNIFNDVFNQFNLYYLAVILLITVAIVLAGALRLNEIASSYGEKKSFYNIFKTYLGSYSIAYLFPIAILSGELFKVYGLRREGIGLEKSISFILIERVMDWTFNLSIILLGMITFSIGLNYFPSQIVAICSFLSFVMISLLFIFYLNIVRRNSIIAYIAKKLLRKKIDDDHLLLEIEKDIYNYFDYRNWSLYKSIFLSALKIFLMQLRIALVIMFITGITIPFFHTFPIIGFSQLSSLIPIPAGLGAYELSQIVVFSSIGLSHSSAVSSSIMIRFTEVTICLLGVFYIFKAGFSFIGNKLNIFEITEDYNKLKNDDQT
ncbi:MAG: lysylphosphatidylglycerol synthase transmembrane domain-containing protein [Candidatus Pacebacteria bacterium]|nr:lysylphosphatidylglycerol synthase transmembrane domain-containing protein [Candidatus Paceibacterota bacterium]